MTELTDNNFDSEVLSVQGKVIVDVWASWCGKCKMIKPLFEELSNKVQGYKFCILDADKCSKIVNKLGITNLPTFIIYEDGKELARGGSEILSSIK